MTTLFNVTYDIVTEESAAEGDVAESGFVSEDSTLRDAMHDVFTLQADVGPTLGDRLRRHEHAQRRVWLAYPRLRERYGQA